MGKGGGSKSKQTTTNTTNVTVQNHIDTSEFSRVMESSSKSFEELTRAGYKGFMSVSKSSTQAINGLNNTLSTLAKNEMSESSKQSEVLKVGSILLGAGLVYYVGKNKIKRGKK